MILESGKASEHLATQFCHIAAGVVPIDPPFAGTPRSLNRLVILRRIRWNEEQFQTLCVLSDERLNGLSLMRADIIQDQVQRAGWVLLQQMLQKPDEFPAPLAVMNLVEKPSRRRLNRPKRVVTLVVAGRGINRLCSLGSPARPNLAQQVEIRLIHFQPMVDPFLEGLSGSFDAGQLLGRFRVASFGGAMPRPFPAPFHRMKVTPYRFHRTDDPRAPQQGLAQQGTGPQIRAMAQFSGTLAQKIQNFVVVVSRDVSWSTRPGTMPQGSLFVAQPLGFTVVKGRNPNAQKLSYHFRRQDAQKQQNHGVKDLWTVETPDFLLQGFAFMVSKAYDCIHQGFRFFGLCSNYQNSVKPCLSKDLCGLI